jgi:hypothetical protein
MEKNFVNRGVSLNGEYFRTRIKLLGPDKYVDFVREEFPCWTQPRNLIIAGNVYKEVTGNELPAVTVEAEKEALQEKVRRLEAMVAEQAIAPAHVVADVVLPDPVEERVTSVSNSGSVRRGRTSTRNT